MEFYPYEPTNANTGEQQVFGWLKEAFRDETGVLYFRYPLFSGTGSQLREPDFLLLHPNLGIWIIETKGIRIENISSIQGSEWYMQGAWHSSTERPIQQAEDQLYALKGKLERYPELRDGLSLHKCVALPFISRKEWTPFENLPSQEGCILFKEDLTPAAIHDSLRSRSGDITISKPIWEKILQALRGTVTDKPPRQIPANTPDPHPIRLIHEVETKLATLDTNQQKIAYEVPEGPQRLRGLAGTGKTVLFCKRIAKMHVKHPDWKIAFLFFSRSMYDSIQNLIQRYYKEMHPDGGEVDWDKVLVMHAWGARERRGFYRSVCSDNGIHAISVSEAKAAGHKSTDDAFLYAVKNLFEKKDKIPPTFDAILIDEGQDLPPVFYKLAYHVLKPPKRLYWAYDEAQGISSLTIPTAAEVFGRSSSGKPLVDLTGFYPGGMKRSHIMNRCYRTHRELLMTAHAINMGLFRKGGALQGLTNQQDWEEIGYKILAGDFRNASGSIRLTREGNVSPHPLDVAKNSRFLESQLVNLHEFTDFKSEIQWVTENICNDLKTGLKPEDLLIVCLDGEDSKDYMRILKQSLTSYQVPHFEAGEDSSTDVFRREGRVTVSGIYRAKGNEAWKVYVLRFEHAVKPVSWKREQEEIHKRNEAFVALTRSRAWCEISGLKSTVFDELREALAQLRGSDSELCFPAFNSRSIKRCLDDISQLELSFYAQTSGL